MSDPFAQFKSMLFLNGHFDPEITRIEVPVTIAADGAAWKLKEIGTDPDIIIGDLDSLKSKAGWESAFSDSEIIEKPDQETNDFEKALHLINSRKLSPCLIAGMQGGDLEYSLNNWSTFIKLCSKIDLAVIEPGRLALPLQSGQKQTINCPAGSLVSLIPQPACRVTTEGLKWELNDEELKLGSREGASNRTTGESFTVSISSGSLLMFIPAG